MQELGRQSAQLKEDVSHGDLMFPVSFSETRVTTDFEVPLYYHWHPHAELLQIIDGRANFQVNGEQILLEPGDLIFFKPNVLHGSHDCFGEYLRFRAVVFDSAFLVGTSGDIISQKYLHTLFSSRRENYIYVKPYTVCSDQLELDMEKTFRHMKRQEEGYEILIKSLLYEMMYYFYSLQSTREDFHPDKRKTVLIRSMVAYVNQHYREKLVLEEVAKQFSFSEGYFCRFFKENFKMTFGEYIQGVRLTEAERLVRDTDMTIEQIAMETGFSDANYFTVCFKKQLHQTPREYRKRRRVRHIRETVQ